jgi:hypothetical protein
LTRWVIYVLVLAGEFTHVGRSSLVVLYGWFPPGLFDLVNSKGLCVRVCCCGPRDPMQRTI